MPKRVVKNLDVAIGKRIRVMTRKQLVKKLDKVFSEYIRKRDGYTCVTCGTKEKPTCGHLFSRVSYSTRWDEEQCFCQCWPENYNHEIDPYPFTSWFIKKYGMEKYDELHQRYKSVRKFKDYQLLELIELYQRKLDDTTSKVHAS